jgi:hypothetical protein
MFPFFTRAERSLHSLLNLITDLVADALLFFRLMFRTRISLSAEVLFLRKQLGFYEERQVQPRRLTDSARFALILWSRLCNLKEALVIVKPQTLIGRHRKGFKLFWKGKSQAGRPRLPENIRRLIVQMAQENPTWGQARVAAELSVKLDIYVSPRTVRAYWPPEPGRWGHRRTSSQNWKTFVRNHAQSIDCSPGVPSSNCRFRGTRGHAAPNATTDSLRGHRRTESVQFLVWQMVSRNREERSCGENSLVQLSLPLARVQRLRPLPVRHQCIYIRISECLASIPEGSDS